MKKQGADSQKKSPSISAAASVSARPEGASEPKEPVNGQHGAAFPARQPTGKKDERISVKVVNGVMDREAFRAEGAERFKEILKATYQSQELRQWAGIETIAAAQAAEVISPKLIGGVLDTLSNLEAMALSAKTGLAFDECKKFMRLDADEHAQLDESGARIAGKYIPVEWLEKVELWTFLGTLIALTAIKVQALQAHAKATFNRTVAADTGKAPTSAQQTASPKRPDVPVEMLTPPPDSGQKPPSYEAPPSGEKTA